jgi:Cullin family
LLRNNAKGFSETEIDDRLSQVIVLFKYIEDKDIFERVGVQLLFMRFFFSSCLGKVFAVWCQEFGCIN